MGNEETKAQSALQGIDLRARGTLLFIRSDVLTQNDGIAGRELCRGLIASIAERPELPEAVILMGSGLWLLEDEGARAALAKMLERGVDVVTCRASVGLFRIGPEKALGRQADTEELAAMLFAADKVLEL